MYDIDTRQYHLFVMFIHLKIIDRVNIKIDSSLTKKRSNFLIASYANYFHSIIIPRIIIKITRIIIRFRIILCIRYWFIGHIIVII